MDSTTPFAANRVTAPDHTEKTETHTAAQLTHFDVSGQAHMVDVGSKAHTHRIARASGIIFMQPATHALISSGSAKKGDVLGIAKIAAIMATKRTSDLIPLCHPLAITRVTVDFDMLENQVDGITGADVNSIPTKDKAAAGINPGIKCIAQVETTGPTGVEMEALTAVQIGLLTIYDMCKAVDRGMVMGDIKVLEKHGGKSGDWVANHL